MVEHDDNKKIFYVVEEDYKAFVNYDIKDGVIDVLTTQVPHAISGRGLASLLMKALYDYAKEKQLKFSTGVTCSYAKSWLQRHVNQN